MKKIKYALTISCILLPLFILVYKYYFLEMSIVPKSVSNVWRAEVSIKTDNFDLLDPDKIEKIRLPKPPNTLSQTIQSTKVLPKTAVKPFFADTESSVIAPSKTWKDVKGKVQITSDISLRGFNYLEKAKAQSKDTTVTLSSEDFKKYTTLPALEESELQDLIKIASSIVFPNDSNMAKLEKFFFYVSDEFILQPDTNTLSDAITLKSGSYLGQARFIAALAKINRIPARISFGIQILKQIGKKTHKYNRVFFTEVFINGYWLPINAHQKKFGVLDDDFVILHLDSEDFADSFNNRDLISIYIEPLVYKNFKTDIYLNDLKKRHPFWSAISLHKFSLSIQSIFFGILLIPFGTVVLSFMRVLVGINTFGIFTPILLSLFFLETSLIFGLTFFFIVVLIGLMQRVLLDRFYILAVPRLSILLTIVILLYIGFAIIAENFGLLSVNNNTLNYFPIVIITVFIERFSIYFIEEGPYNTLKTTLGTFSVSLLCYFLLSVVWLKELIFNNPELIILAIGINLIIGNYKGYRLLEYFRFHQIADES